MVRRRAVAALMLAALALGALLLWAACPAAPPRPPPKRPREERSLAALDHLIASPLPRPQGSTVAAFNACMQRVDATGLCLPDAKVRTLDVRLALDERYLTQWTEPRARLSHTLRCVNELYAGTGLRFRFSRIQTWSPAAQRHELYGLLDRLQREFPADSRSLMLGITVWDENKIYGLSGGEIGLSQYAACVVPSWPRVENDCLILAHELGHLVGAEHVPQAAGEHWIMGWAARPFYLPADNPLRRVVALYRFHPRNQAAIAAHKNGRFTPGGFVAVGACRQRLDLIERCWTGATTLR